MTVTTDTSLVARALSSLAPRPYFPLAWSRDEIETANKAGVLELDPCLVPKPCVLIQDQVLE